MVCAAQGCALFVIKLGYAGLAVDGARRRRGLDVPRDLHLRATVCALYEGSARYARTYGDTIFSECTIRIYAKGRPRLVHARRSGQIVAFFSRGLHASIVGTRSLVAAIRRHSRPDPFYSNL